jgi:hypothetical protein
MSAQQRRENGETPVTEKDVELLFTFCRYARYVYRHYKVLFDNDQDRRDLLWNTAPFLFGDIDRVLIEYIPLQICKLTDREKDARGNESLTIEFFLKNSDFSDAPETLRRLEDFPTRYMRSANI